jgi:hypothetical protein
MADTRPLMLAGPMLRHFSALRSRACSTRVSPSSTTGAGTAAAATRPHANTYGYHVWSFLTFPLRRSHLRNPILGNRATPLVRSARPIARPPDRVMTSVRPQTG